MTVPARYRAFISYSHRDGAWGTWLHRGIERYRVPAALVGRKTRAGPVPTRLFPVFRDREELPTAADLGRVIEEALAASDYLVVICSPRSAQSRWVGEEIRQFKALHGEDRVLAVIVDGEPNAADQGQPDDECFPEALRYRVDASGALTDVRTEPIAADARDTGDGRDDALLKVLAGLLGVNFNDLKQREAIEARRRARRAQIIAAAMAMLAVAAGVGGIFAYLQKIEADDARSVAEDRRVEAEQARRNAVIERDAALVAQSRFLADRARAEIGEGDPSLALLLALEALPQDLAAPGRPFVPAAAAALSSAMQGRTDLAFLPHRGAVTELGVSPDGGWSFTAAIDDGLYLGDAAGRQIVRLARLDGGQLHWAGFSPDSRFFATETSDGVTVWRVGTSPEKVLQLTAAQLYDIPSDGFPNIGGAAFSPDSSRIAVIETTGRLSVIEIERGTRRSALLDGASDDQRWFTLGWTEAGISAVHDFNILDLVDPEDISVVRRVEVPEVAGSRFGANIVVAPGARRILLTNDLATALVDPEGPRVLASFETDDGKAIRFSPDGTRLLVPDRRAGTVGRLRVIDAETGQETHRLPYAVSGWGPVDIAVARDGRTIDEVYSGAIYRRDLATGEVIASRSVLPVDGGGAFFARALALADGALLLGTWRDAGAVWTPDPAAESVLIPHDGEAFERMAWVAGGERLLLAETSRVPALADPVTGALVARLGSDSALAQEIAVSPDGDLIVVPAENAPMAVYRASTGALAWTHGCRVLTAPRFVSVGLVVPSGCEPGVFMTLLDPSSGQKVRSYRYQPPEDDMGLSYARLVVEGTGGVLFAATSADMFIDVPARVVMFPALHDAPPVEALSREGRVDHIVRAPGGPVLATFDDGWLAALDSETGTVLWQVEAGEGRVRLYTGGDGRFAVTIPDGFGDAGSQRIWDLETGEIAAELGDLRGLGVLPDPVFGPAGRWVQLGAPSGVGESAGRVVLWDTTRREVSAEAAMPGFFGPADLLPDGRLLARAEGRALGLWDPLSLQRLATLLEGRDTVDAVAFSPDGKRVAALVPEEATRIAPLPVFDQRTLDVARRLAGRTLTSAERNRFFLPSAPVQ